jgi:hypothetical protein
VRSRARSITADLRRRTEDKIAEVKRINGDLAGIAERVARQADASCATLAASYAPLVIRPRSGRERRSPSWNGPPR